MSKSTIGCIGWVWVRSRNRSVICVAGATNAALLAAAILANGDEKIRAAVDAFRAAQTDKVLAQPDPRNPTIAT